MSLILISFNRFQSINSTPSFSTGSLPISSGLSTLNAHHPPPHGASAFSPAGASLDLATLLATSLANMGPFITPPVVLSSVVPKKVVETIRSGAFFTFGTC
uniref:Uncharacterized protein n=1 Tax=Amphimedon queenslandica TaxID=400682 RepID=A0A1X7VHG0_AMPQE